MSKIRPEVAKRRIESFEKRFGKAHLYLAYHAAFPLSLTPDLLYRLWANFQRDIHGEVLGIPWVAVADLLLSSLCDEVGHELYEMDLTVRNGLLSRLQEDEKFGQQRIHELSDFLLEYVQQQLLSDDPDIRDFAQAQRWTALAYTQPSKVARELELIFQNLDQKDKAELLRIASLTETFAQPLAEFQPLLIYARGIANFARGNLDAATSKLGEVFEERKQISVAGVSLPVPEEIKANFPPPQVPPSKKQKSSLLSLFTQWLIPLNVVSLTLILGVPTLVLGVFHSFETAFFSSDKNTSSPTPQSLASASPTPAPTASVKKDGNLVENSSNSNSNLVENSSYINSLSITEIPITQEDAVKLIKTWLRAKQQILAPPYNSQLATELTTGQQYGKVNDSIDWLRKNNAYYQYGLQRIDNVNELAVEGEQATIQVQLTEEITLFEKNRNINSNATDFKTRTVRYTLQFVDGRWKIASSQVVE
ncbi:MAG: ARC6/PARC6 family protein [Iphinoe sp. HA4291-MV1]|jgi:hypothetical protein|nr:ARC6/PARC6 family protein [Iphinoe sp. HA4291-MV1]